MFKSLFSLILLSISMSVLAGPAQEERQQFCVAVAQTAAQAAAAKNLGFPKEAFDEKVKELEHALSDPDVGLSKAQQREVVQAVKEAYAKGGPVATRMQEAFDTCMKQKTT